MSLSFFLDLIIPAPIIAVIFIIVLRIYRVCFHHSNNVTLDFPCRKTERETYITEYIEEPHIILCQGHHNSRPAPPLPCKSHPVLSGLFSSSLLQSLQMNCPDLSSQSESLVGIGVGVEPSSNSQVPFSLGSPCKFTNSHFYLLHFGHVIVLTFLSCFLSLSFLHSEPLFSQPTFIPREPSYSLPPQRCSQYLDIYLTLICEAWQKCLGNGKENKHALSPGPLVLACYKYLRVASQFQHQWHGNLFPSSGPLLDHSSLVWEGFSQQLGLKGGWVSGCVQCAQGKKKKKKE